MAERRRRDWAHSTCESASPAIRAVRPLRRGALTWVYSSKERLLNAINTFTLLHVANVATRVTTLDLRVLAAAILLFAAVSTLLWAPVLSARSLWPRRRARRRIASLVVGAAVFFAVMPSVLPWDHLFLDSDHHTAAEEQVHASHCHESPGTCSDAPVSSGPGQLMLTAPLVVVPAMLGVLMLFGIPTLTGVTLRPDLRPPLSPRRRNFDLAIDSERSFANGDATAFHARRRAPGDHRRDGRGMQQR